MMLRIISKQQGTTYRLELHGTVAGEWIAVLEHHWRDILYAVPSATIAVGVSKRGFHRSRWRRVAPPDGAARRKTGWGRSDEPVRHRKNFRRCVMSSITGVMPAIRGEVRQSATWSIVLSILMMISGVLALAIPPVAGLTVTVMLGWLLIITGGLHLGFAWRGEGAAAIFGEIAIALLYGAVGLYMLARPVAGSRR
jgi:Uncharacterized conserved protein